MTPTVRLPRTEPAVLAVFAVFTLSGATFASWASRIPQVRAQLGLTTRELGLLLLALPTGAVLALAVAGPLVTFWGPRRALVAFSRAAALGLAAVGIGAHPAVHAVPLVAAGLALLGFSTGVWDVAISVTGAGLEVQLGRVLMPRFHAASSAGSVTGAALGAAATAAHVPVAAHFGAVAALIGLGVTVLARQLPFAHPSAKSRDQELQERRALRAWTEPRTLLLGLFVLTAAFSEGSANDWLAVAVVDGHHAAPGVASASFMVFVAAMVLGRWYGSHLVGCYGPVTALRASGALAVTGLLLLIYGHSTALAVASAAAWGLGTALGFPLGVSAAGRDPSRAAARVSVVSTIGYTAFLAGPPLLGLVGQHTGALHALTVPAAVIAAGTAIAGVVRVQGDERVDNLDPGVAAPSNGPGTPAA